MRTTGLILFFIFQKKTFKVNDLLKRKYVNGKKKESLRKNCDMNDDVTDGATVRNINLDKEDTLDAIVFAATAPAVTAAGSFCHCP